ncbi:MAG: hypothetical protein HYW78_01895 [Parcubacteria group bacterium]|nr:hypothetical protein [Parcubacteria group bacterium]
MDLQERLKLIEEWNRKKSNRPLNKNCPYLVTMDDLPREKRIADTEIALRAFGFSEKQFAAVQKEIERKIKKGRKK